MLCVQVQDLLVEDVAEDGLRDPAHPLGHEVVQPSRHLALQLLRVAIKREGGEIIQLHYKPLQQRECSSTD